MRTSVPEERLGPVEAVLAYKRLTRVERAFRSLKTTRLRVRPPDVCSEQHARGPVFLCMLGTPTLNRVTPTRDAPHGFELLARRTPLQAKAFELLEVDPERVVSSRLTV